MKIAMMIDSWFPIMGGGPIHVLELSKKLVLNHNCKIDIFTRALKHETKKFDKNEELLNGRLRIFRLNPCLNFWNPIGRLSYLFTPLLKIKKYDVIHAHAYEAGIPAYFLHRTRGIPVIFTVQGTGLGCWEDLGTGIKKVFMRKLEEFILLKLKYNHVITVSKDFLSIAKKYHQNITYIPNGVNMEKFYGEMEETNDLLFVGRFTRQKSVDTLVNAMKYVIMEKPNTKLKLIGYGPQEDKLRELAKKLGLNNIIFNYTNGDELVKEYLSSKVFVLPSVYEGFPLTLLEAWAASLSVIATNVPGIRELVRHKKNGLLVEPKDPRDLAKAIIYTLNNPQEAKKWANSGRRFSERFSWNEVSKRTFKVYKEVIG